MAELVCVKNFLMYQFITSAELCMKYSDMFSKFDTIVYRDEFVVEVRNFGANC